MLNMELWITVSIVGLILLLAAERRNAGIQRAVFKLAASTAFILAAVAGGAFQSRYGCFVFAGLVLSWFGDAFLLGVRPAIFQAGLVSFLLAHVTYVGAFIAAGLVPAASGIALIVVVGVAVFVIRWLKPHLTDDMRYPVYAYIAVISAMVVFATGATLRTGHPAILIAAVMFYLSDITVARSRFVSPGFVNGLVGLPLYYGGQLVFAYSVSLFAG